MTDSSHEAIATTYISSYGVSLTFYSTAPVSARSIQHTHANRHPLFLKNAAKWNSHDGPIRITGNPLIGNSGLSCLIVANIKHYTGKETCTYPVIANDCTSIDEACKELFSCITSLLRKYLPINDDIDFPKTKEDNQKQGGSVPILGNRSRNCYQMLPNWRHWTDRLLVLSNRCSVGVAPIVKLE